MEQRGWSNTVTRRRLTVADIAALKGKRQLTMLRIFTLVRMDPAELDAFRSRRPVAPPAPEARCFRARR